MADSTGNKVPKTVEKHKISNMINRTTSESLRVGDSDKILNHPTSLSASTTTPRKKTSFQITSVTVGAHMSNDGGDDSADDLDESHTEDISDVIDTSRVTDIENETPSYSEDTFSKDDVFFNSSTSLGSAPVIPTSSQYGLAIVSTPEGCGNLLNNSLNCSNSLTGNELHVSVTDNVINLGLVGSKHLDAEMRDLHSHPGRNERFKVVKIESTEPFKRGRWMCMDYLDHTMQQQSQNNLNAARPVESVNEIATVNQCTGTDSGISMSEHPNFNSVPDDQVPVVDQNISLGTNKLIEIQNVTSHPQVNMSSVQTSISPGQTMQFNTQQIQSGINSNQPQVIQQAQSLTTVPQNQQNLINTNHHQSLQQQQIQQVIGSSNLINQQPTPIQNQQPQHQPMSQPLQQMQQGVHMQHIIPLQQQSQPSSNIQQQFQQQPPIMHQQIQQPSHQQNMQQQPVLHQQQQIQQHITQTLQHPHPMTMPMQQQPGNQVPVSQTLIQGQQQTLQQIPPQATSQQLHQMQQQGQTQHMQHASIPQHSVPGVSCPQLQQQTSQPSQQQVYHPASQPIIQPGMVTQPNLIPQQQTQYFTNTQPLQGGTLSAQAMHPPNTLQAQPQQSSSINVPLQQTYPITSVSQQQQPQQIQVVHPGAPANIQHVPSSQMLSSTIQMAPVTSLSVGSNLQIPPPQCTVLSPQATSQGTSLVQQQCYVSQPGAQPVVSSVAPTQIIGGSQTLASSAVNVVPSTSVLDNTSAFSNEMIPSDQMIQSTMLLESLVDAAASGEEVPPVEDAERSDKFSYVVF